jgi:hypothetical protein
MTSCSLTARDTGTIWSICQLSRFFQDIPVKNNDSICLLKVS